jgi:hypothetical protein
LKTYRTIHTVTLLAMLWETVKAVYTSVHFPFGSPMEQAIQPFAAAALWGFLVWKIWQRPQTWGLGVGLFYCVAVGFRAHFWFATAARHPDAVARGEFRNVDLVWSLIPIAAAGAGCLLLWFLREKGKDQQPSTAPNSPPLP